MGDDLNPPIAIDTKISMPVPPPYPALHASHAGIWIAEPGGEIRCLDRGQAIKLVADTPVIMLGAPMVGARLGYGDVSGLDLLELFAFVHPARFCVPTARGLAAAIGVSPGNGGDPAIPVLLLVLAQSLLSTLSDPAWPERIGAWDAAQGLSRARWSWAGEVARRLPIPPKGEPNLFSRLPEWEEEAPPPRPLEVVLSADDVAARLAQITAAGGESRDGQRRMALATAAIFAPRPVRGTPHMVLADAGTGIGKTRAYLAPASLWTHMSGGSVTVSTYTKNLQRQLAQETRALYPDEGTHRARVVVRKGRENYLCLLNLEDALQGGFSGRSAIFARLVARWTGYTRDGDMVGGDLPGWLISLFRRTGSTALTDRRGECVYAGCVHWRKCFIERSVRASRHADIVIANHALTMINAARGRDGDAPPTRIIFDEGHHLFDAADSIFAVALTGQEAIEMRRWIIGPESQSRGRRRGLAARLSDVAGYDEQGAEAIEAACHAAMALPSDGWLQRLAEGTPLGPVEGLLRELRTHVYARDGAAERDGDPGYGLEAELADPDARLVAAASAAAKALEALLRPLMLLGQRMTALLDDAPDWLDAQARARIEGALVSLGYRGETISAWVALAARIGGPPDPAMIDWLSVERIEGREMDVGVQRRWIDPTGPLARTILSPAHGVLVTSATLALGDWERAEARSGAAHLPGGAQHFHCESPFDYAANSEVIIVTDIRRGDIAALAGGYARLIEAAGGGVLGLFTAIRRLRAVHARIADHLARNGLPVLAQHVDPIDTGTLVDIFRDDPRASLLGTDALRDGVDVPGGSLRMVVMEGVPWVKPNIVYAARRMAARAGGSSASAYDDAMVRTRLAQGFGRLIRRASDRGRFVMLSGAMPSRLLGAFPPATPVHRMTLDAALAHILAHPMLDTAPVPAPADAPR